MKIVLFRNKLIKLFHLHLRHCLHVNTLWREIKVKCKLKIVVSPATP